MDIHATKLELMQKIMNVSAESLLVKSDKLLDEEMVVGYTTSGEPLTKAAYDERLAVAEQQFTDGEYLTQEELEKEAENW